MDKLFLTILNMSLTGAFVIAAICLARLPLKKAPKIISYCLWAVAGFRLVFPFSIESVFSLIPFRSQPIPPDIAMQTVPRIDSGIGVIDNAISASLPAASTVASANPLQIWQFIGSWIWLIGVALMLIYGVVSYLILKQKMGKSTHIKENIYEAENIGSPFVLGIFAPKIYLPFGLSEQEREYILLHEQTHIRRHDHIIKFAAYFILCLHWFNPLAWMAFLLMGVDMEMSCDERVLKEMGSETKKDYSLSLLSLATERRIISGSPLAFSEAGLKARIKNVLDFKKPSSVIIVAAVALVAVLSIGFAVNRAEIKYNSYIYDDSDSNVKFSIEYPENWNLGERRGWDSDETSEASPDTGIQFSFSENGTENFTIAAMRFSSLSFNQEGYKAEEFITDNNLRGSKYTDSDEDFTSVFYIFGVETDSPPHYFASVNMNTQIFEKYKLDIEKVMKSFKVLANGEATVPEEKTPSLPTTINIPVVREGATELLIANLAVSDLGYAIYLFEDFVLTSTDGGDVIHPTESSTIMKTLTMGVVLADDESPLPKSKAEGGIYTDYHRVTTTNNAYDVTLSYPLEAAEGGAVLLRAMMDTVVAIESPVSAEFINGTWKVSKFLGFTAITKDDVDWPDGENIIGRTVIIGSELFSTMDFGTEYAKYAVEIQNPVYRHTYTEKGYDFAKYLSPTADKSILELNNEDIRLINAETSDSEISGPALYSINNERLLISLNCDYFELEKVSSQIDNDRVYKTEEDFLNSTEGIIFQSVAYEAAKALLCADADELAKYMLNPNEASRSIRGMTNVFENVEDLTLVWNLDSIKSDNEVHASYRYYLDGEDSLSYVTMELIKDSDIWKVKWLGIEK